MSLLKRWFSKQQKQINQSDIKALMRSDLARAGIKSAPYLEEYYPASFWKHGSSRLSIPPGSTWTRLISFLVPCAGQWEVVARIHWARGFQEVVTPRNLYLYFMINQGMYHQGKVDEGTYQCYSSTLDLATDDLFSLSVYHDMPDLVEIEYDVTVMDLLPKNGILERVKLWSRVLTSKQECSTI